MRRLQFEHIYICRNCEDEFRGHPFGYRLASHLPLCRRCTKIGEKEGVADRIITGNEEGLSSIIVYFLVALALFASIVLVKMTSPRSSLWS
jgi:hypothetical protein